MKVPEVPAWTPGADQRKHGGGLQVTFVPWQQRRSIMKAHASLANEENKEKAEIREAAAIHMLMASDACPIRSTHMLKVDAALVLHSGTIDARFNKGRSSGTPPESRPTTDSLRLADSTAPRSFYGLPSNLFSYRLDE